MQTAGIGEIGLRLACERTQGGAVVVVEPLDGEPRCQVFEHDASLDDLVEPSVDAVEVEHHRLGNRLDRRLGDDEAATRASARTRDLLVLDQPDGLAEHRAAHAVALEQLSLAPEHLAHRPSKGHDVLDDLVGNARGALAIGASARAQGRRNAARAGLGRHRGQGTAALSLASVIACHIELVMVCACMDRVH